MSSCAHRQRVYDHRLRQAVRERQDPHLFPELRIPRSTLAGWLRDSPPDVVTADCLVTNDLALALKVQKVERRCGVLTALVRLLLTLVRVQGLGLEGGRLPDGEAKARVLRAIDSATRVLPLSAAHVALRKRVLDKHGLKDTFVEGYETITGGMIKGYGLAGGKTLKDVTDDIHPTVPGAAGCMVSTVADLTLFFNLLRRVKGADSAPSGTC